MAQFKTLSSSLVAAVVAATTLPMFAQVELRMSTNKVYRQSSQGMDFLGGDYEVDFRDGDGIYRAGCVRAAYWRPNIPLDPCPGGSTAYLLYGGGGIIGEPDLGLYYWVEQVIPAIAIEPRRPDKVGLKAAPASTFPRGLGGFVDNSFSLFFNLHTVDIQDYVSTGYSYSKSYNAGQLAAFEQEIVLGEYFYQFPRLRNPDLVQAISAKIFPIVEGRRRVSNQNIGVEFNTNEFGTWSPEGFLQLSVSAPNTITWKGFNQTNVLAAVDTLYFTIRGLEDPTDPLSERTAQTIFPGFTGAADARVKIPTPFATSFTLPPIFPAGMTGVVELELQRRFQTSGVAFDLSTRRFQIPIIFVP